MDKKEHINNINILEHLNLHDGQYAINIGNINGSKISNLVVTSCLDSDDKSDFSGYGEEDTEKNLNDIFLHGNIAVCGKSGQVDYYSDESGTWTCKSNVNAIWYRNSHTRSIAIPQCKMMNSTVREWDAIRKVYANENGSDNGKGLHSKEIIEKQGLEKDEISLRDENLKESNRHISFDVWTVIGAVYGHALTVYRKLGKNKNKLPNWLYLPYSEIFRILNPEYKWTEISNTARIKWKKYFRSVFKELNETSLTFDLPDERWGRTRTQYHWPILMKTHEVFWSMGEPRQVANSIKHWGTEKEPVGVKINLKGTGLFDFVFEKSTPRLVQINNFDLKTKTLWGSQGGLCRGFQTIYMNWLVQYRNYFLKRGFKYKTLELKWSQKEMNKSFKGTSLKLRRLSTEEMQKMLDSISISARNKKDKTDKYPAHINESYVIAPCVVGWNLPTDIRNEDIFAKDKNGVAYKIDMEGASEEVKKAHQIMLDLNKVNSGCEVLFNKEHLNTHMATIYRVDGNRKVIQDNYGRCYSFQNGIQSLKSDDRLKITIDGEKVSEIDYSGLHTRMLYAMENQTVNGDIYDLGNRWYLKHGLTKDEAREAVKKAILIMINASTQWKGYYAFKKDWNESHKLNKKLKITWLYNLMEDIKIKHTSISKYFCSNKGIELQWKDGIIIRNVCWHFAKKGVCALPVHDSLVIAKQYQDEAIAVMQSEFAKMLNGIQIPVKVK